MSDDAGANAPANQGGTDNAGTPRTFTQEELDRIVGERLGREREKFADHDALRAKAEQFDALESEKQSDVQRLTGEVDSLKAEVAKLSPENARLRVAVDKGLVGDKSFLAERLRGETVEELAADADSLLERWKQQDGGAATDFDGGARETPPAKNDPKQLAADVPRGW